MREIPERIELRTTRSHGTTIGLILDRQRCNSPFATLRNSVVNVGRVCSVLIASVLGLAACGGRSNARRSTPPREVTPSRSSGSSVLTQPGAKLAVGQGATVPFEIPGSFPGSSPVFWLRITVGSVVKDSTPGMGAPGTPYSVRFKITNVGALDPAPYLFAAIPELRSTGTVGFTGGFIGSSLCDGPPPPQHLPRGATWTSCQSFLAAGTVTGVAYTGSDPRYKSSPITWK